MRAGLPCLAIAWSAVLVSGCVSAKINVVDERTALENQILGSYEELDRDMQLLASVRAVDEAGKDRQPPSYTRERQQAIAARQTQQFNRDDIDELKKAGCLGEAQDGSLAARPCDRSSDQTVAERLERLIASENQARGVILRFAVTVSPDLTDRDLPQVTAAYARMQREKAKSGEWIQEPGGEWVRKD
jgi:uncharacterized protein YdbL (DUF1318 family)